MSKFKDYYHEFMLRLNTSLQLHGVNKGIGNYVFGSITVAAPDKLRIGNKCRINHGAYLNAAGGIELGDDVTISAGASLLPTGIDYINWANGNRSHSRGSIVIGSHVWIGANAVILPGTKISGTYVVVGANAVITHDITEDYCVVAGNPGKIIKCYIIL